MIEYTSLSRINGPLIALDEVENAVYDEIVRLHVGKKQILARVVSVEGGRAVLQVFGPTAGISLSNCSAQFTGKPMRLSLSREILGRTFNGVGEAIDGGGEIYAEKTMDVNGLPINPVSRQYPQNYIKTGVSAIDCLCTLIRGQKLPIFSCSGLAHNQLAAQITKQARLSENDGAEFCVVFAAMGVKNDVAEYFKKSFAESGAASKVVMFLNLSNDPIIERILTPRCALTAAEYLAFSQNMHVLVIMTDMSSYAEALREFSSSKGEIPARKGFPGYLYSDLASLYERAGMIEGSGGSITQIPILTMPGDDITHPIPDLTGYITEGQIVFDRALSQKGVYPPISVLPSLSRLMKDGVGEGFTRDDHPDVANALFACYSAAAEARSLASVIGEDELSESDKRHLRFADMFENEFINQGENEDRSLEKTLSLAWRLLSIFPRGELNRISDAVLDKYYDSAGSAMLF